MIKEKQHKHVYSYFPFLLAETPRNLNQVTINYHYQSSLCRVLKFCGTTFVKTAVYGFQVGSKLNVARPSLMKSHEDCLLRSYIFTKNGMHVCDLFVYVFKPERLVCTSSGRRRRWTKSCTRMLRTLKSFLHFLKPNDTNNCQK